VILHASHQDGNGITLTNAELTTLQGLTHPDGRRAVNRRLHPQRLIKAHTVELQITIVFVVDESEHIKVNFIALGEFT